MEELNLGPPNTIPSSGNEEDLNPGPLDYKSSTLTTRPGCLHVKLTVSGLDVSLKQSGKLWVARGESWVSEGSIHTEGLKMLELSCTLPKFSRAYNCG